MILVAAALCYAWGAMLLVVTVAMVAPSLSTHTPGLVLAAGLAAWAGEGLTQSPADHAYGNVCWGVENSFVADQNWGDRNGGSRGGWDPV